MEQMELFKETLTKEGTDVAQKNATRKPEEISAEFFVKNYPMYKRFLTTLGKKDLSRLCEALIGFPIEIQAPKFQSEAAKAAFSLGHTLMDMKMMIRMAVMTENYKQEASSENKAESVVTESATASKRKKKEKANG